MSSAIFAFNLTCHKKNLVETRNMKYFCLSLLSSHVLYNLFSEDQTDRQVVTHFRIILTERVEYSQEVFWVAHDGSFC